MNFCSGRCRWVAALVALAFGGSLQADTLRLLAPPGYLPAVGVLVRVEVVTADGARNRGLWDAEATLGTEEPGVTLSTNRVALKNGLGSALITIAGETNINLTATLGSLQATRPLAELSSAPVTTVAGTLAATNVIWSGVVRVTNDVTVPVGGTLTLQPGTLVLLSGVSSGTTAPDIFVNGAIQSLGTESQPVTITCASAALRWGQIRHATAQPSLYRHTIITRGGRTAGEGHTGTGPVIRTGGSRITFEHCSLTDHADANGTPGKIMYATASVLAFDDCLFARARMGPEVTATEVVCSNTWFLEMRGPDDADAIYIHAQNPGQVARLNGCVMAGGDDDGLDTLGSEVTAEDCVIRDWNNLLEDAKGISVFHGEVTVRRSVIVHCTDGVSAKSSGAAARVNLANCTVTGIRRGIAAAWKANAAAGNILFCVTNCIVRSVDAVYTDFGATNFNIGYCNLSTPWPGVGNFTADPLFVDAATNHHLRLASPCLDAGDPASPLDPDGTRADVGALAYAQDGDSDLDGMTDGWEAANGLNAFAPDAAPDPDLDGFSNFQEYLAGTRPLDHNDYLRFESIGVDAGALLMHFHAADGRTYSVLFRDDLLAGPWHKLVDVPATNSRQVRLDDPDFGAASNRFYRLVAPAQFGP